MTVMQTRVTPEQRQAAKREIVQQVEQGASAKFARMQSSVLMHRTTVYRLLKRVQSEGEKALTDGRHGHPVKLRGEVLTISESNARRTPVSPVLQYNVRCTSALVMRAASVN